jgi:DNA excision repair protein ERCC-3
VSELEDSITSLKVNLAKVGEQFSEIQRTLQEREATIRKTMQEVLDGTRLTQVDPAKQEEFLKIFPKRPYAIVSKTEQRALVACPIHIPLAIGWLIKQDGAYNIWEVNKFIPLFQPVPQDLLEELDFRPAFDGLTVEAGEIHIARPDIDQAQEVFKHYRRYLSRVEDEQTIRIKPNQDFEVIAALIRDGILPFTPHPVAKDDLRSRHDLPSSSLELRDYQQRDYEKWLANGTVGLQYPMGAGKSFVALYAMQMLKGRKLVLVPTKTLKEQWTEYIHQYLTIPAGEWVVEVYHQTAMKRLKDQEFSLIVFDEMHRLPANTFLQLATLKCKYRLNLTGTPWREDGRHDLVFALSGLPLGVDWQFFIKQGIIKPPEITIHVVRDLAGKFAKLDELMQAPGKTLIFCDLKALGRKISERYHIPFVSGETQERLATVRANEKVAISRVGDLGLSLKDLAQVIEFDFLFGSRTQFAQREGRMHHAKKAGHYHSIMTVYEYLRYRKRFSGLESKGFAIRILKEPGVEKALEYGLSAARGERVPAPVRRAPPPPTKAAVGRVSAAPQPALDVAAAVASGALPFISDRAKPDRDTVLLILGSRLAREHQGLRAQDVGTVLTHFYIRFDGKALARDLWHLYEAGTISGRRISKGVRRYFYEPPKEAKG